MKTVPVVLKTLLIALALTAAPVLAQGGTEGGSSSAVTGSGTINSVAKFSGTTTVTNSNLTEVNGYVGIGTPNPVANLTIANPSYDGVSTPQQGLVFLDTTSGTANAWTHAAIYSIGSTQYNGSLIFATDGDGQPDFGVTEKMRIDPFGNVGIGTSTPSTTLEVKGSITMTAGSGGGIIFPDGTRQFTAASGGSGSVASVPAGISEVGNFIGIGTPTPVGNLTVANSSNDTVSDPTQGIVFVDSGRGPGVTPWTHAAIYTVGSTQFNGSLVFATDGDNADDFGVTEKMRIDPFGHVGIGTASPSQALEVVGNVQLDGAGNGIKFPDGTVQSTAYTGNASTSGGFSTSANGNVGIGTTNPAYSLTVNGSFSATSAYVNGNQIPYPITIPGIGGSSEWVKLGTLTAGQGGISALINIVSNNGYNAALSQNYEATIRFNTSNGSSVDGNGFAADSSYYTTGLNTLIPGSVKWVANNPGLAATAYDLYINLPSFPGTSFYIVNTSGSWTPSPSLGVSDPGVGSATVLIASDQYSLNGGTLFAGGGNIGIGTTSPSTKLEVNGNVKLTGGSGASITFADGTVQTTAYNGTSCALADLVMPDKTIVAQGGDYAESVDVDGEKAAYEPGDVMAIGEDANSDVTKSTEAYSTRVAGIYSTKPGYVGRRQTGDPKAASDEIPMAMIGIVPTKVSAENGSVHRGDLLVSSSHAGYAMKGTDRTRMVGAVVGKAMGSLESGKGIIEVLVTLQ